MKLRNQLKMACSMAGIMLCFILSVSAQNAGIKFEHGLSWKEIKEKAKKENKYIFMDCFTTWCGPCKMMSKNIFPQKEVGDVFNERFINVKAQMDKTSNDNDEVKAWYADADAIAKEYNIMAYPTFLYFSPEGKLVHLFVGSTKEAKMFIDKSMEALDPSTQYFTKMDTAVNAAGSDPDALRNLALKAKKKYDGVNSQKLANEYFKHRKDVYTKEHLAFMNEFTRSSSDAGFNTFVNNTAKIDAVMGKGFSQKKITSIVFREADVYGFRMNKTEPDLKAIKEKIKKIAPSKTGFLMARFNIQYLQLAKKNKEWLKDLVSFLKKYGSQVCPEELSGFAKYAFSASEDPKVQMQALAWSKQAVSESESPENLSTYATLLYKFGKKDEAIAAQKKAVALSENNIENEYRAKSYKKTLTKMEKGELI